MEILYWLESTRTPFLDTVISLITHLGAETLFMVISLVFFWCVDKHRGYFLLFSGFCGIVCTQILKMSFRIPRPWVIDPNFTIVESARAEATGYSFPSGHMQCATSLYGGIARSAKKRAVQIAGAVIALLIGFSRMYLGVHTLKDVLVSLAVGTAVLFLVYPLIERTRTNPRAMYIVIAIAAALSLGNLLFVTLYRFPADIDPVNLTDAIEVAWKLFAAVVGICLIYPIDQKYVRFSTQAVWWAQILKLIGGVAIVVAVRSLTKAPLNALLGASVGGAVRYFLMVMSGGLLWPMTFRYFERLK